MSQLPATPPSDSGRRWYRGDCHLHSVFSNGGQLTPEQLAANARATGLDFVATTEHNTASTHDAWSRLGSDDLLVILGQEVTTQTGHWLALGLRPGQVVDWRYGLRDNMIDHHLRQVRSAGGLCVAAHPHAPHPTGAFLYSFDGFDAVEVWNGPWSSDLPWQADNETALADWQRSLIADVRQGQWRPVIGNSDTHLENQIGIPHTVVLADERSVDAILAGIRAGRSWIASSGAVNLAFTASSGDHAGGIGETLEIGDKPAAARVDVRGVPSGEVSLHTEQGKVCSRSLPRAGSGSVEWHTNAHDAAFVRTEIRNVDGQMVALTNPIILT